MATPLRSGFVVVAMVTVTGAAAQNVTETSFAPSSDVQDAVANRLHWTGAMSLDDIVRPAINGPACAAVRGDSVLMKQINENRKLGDAMARAYQMMRRDNDIFGRALRGFCQHLEKNPEQGKALGNLLQSPSHPGLQYRMMGDLRQILLNPAILPNYFPEAGLTPAPGRDRQDRLSNNHGGYSPSNVPR